MRKIVNINGNWKFSMPKGDKPACVEDAQLVNLPHTWNAIDGQDGGGDYFRGACLYVKEFNRPEMGEDERLYLEFNAVNAEATVTLNGHKLGYHAGGYSRFRFDITDFVEDKNVLEVIADNSVNLAVYPQRADFTFYGGIYRDVNLIIVNKNHFDLDHHGSLGFQADPIVKEGEKDATCKITGYVTGNGKVVTKIQDHEGKVVATGANEEELIIKDVHLWDGFNDPYLYTATVSLLDENDNVLDEISSEIGFRSFRLDAKKGFFLNGKSYPLRGVAKHQDWAGIGNAINHTNIETDINMIVEMGANTVRLAHYQHDDYTYTMCDRVGLVVWSEIPYISKHEDVGDENTMSQMTELICQTYNHPSIFIRGLSNEITMKKAGPDRLENHKRLQALCKKLDPNRVTVTAGFAAIGLNNPLNFVGDVFSFNYYGGWYVPFGTMLFRVMFPLMRFLHPKTVIGLSEYGAEAMTNLHTAKPKRFDNTEEYASILHEKMLKFFSKRPYIWATHCWNMFDFGADARNQGGDPGKNHKGLVTFDRKIKKDPFYVYKAWLSKDPFVHLCGTRFVNRYGSKTEIKAYSNLNEVSFYLNDQLFKTVKGEHVFKVKMPLTDGMKVRVEAGEFKEECVFHKVAERDPAYILPEGGNSYSWEKKKAGADEGAKRAAEKKD